MIRGGVLSFIEEKEESVGSYRSQNIINIFEYQFTRWDITVEQNDLISLAYTSTTPDVYIPPNAFISNINYMPKGDLKNTIQHKFIRLLFVGRPIHQVQVYIWMTKLAILKVHVFRFCVIPNLKRVDENLDRNSTRPVASPRCIVRIWSLCSDFACCNIVCKSSILSIGIPLNAMI